MMLSLVSRINLFSVCLSLSVCFYLSVCLWHEISSSDLIDQNSKTSKHSDWNIDWEFFYWSRDAWLKWIAREWRCKSLLNSKLSHSIRQAKDLDRSWNFHCKSHEYLNITYKKVDMIIELKQKECAYRNERCAYLNKRCAYRNEKCAYW